MQKTKKPSAVPSEYDIAHSNMQFENCAQDLLKANAACAVETAEKEKRVTELLLANQEVASLNLENDRIEAELALTKKKLGIEKKEKRKRAQKLLVTKEDLKTAKDSESAHIETLREMMFITSHQLRRPVVQILGLAEILDTSVNSPEELNEIVDHMKESAETLNDMTKELTTFIHHEEVKASYKRGKKK